MVTIHLVSLSNFPTEQLLRLQQTVADEIPIPVQFLQRGLDIEYAYDSVRQQYYSSKILLGLKNFLPAPSDRILGITDVDLFIPILTYVFGEAQLNGPAAVVSRFRLLPEFYGLPQDKPLADSRLAKEAIHELGHTFGLRHCRHFDCVMHASTYADEIDLKGNRLCEECREMAALNWQA